MLLADYRHRHFGWWVSDAGSWGGMPAGVTSTCAVTADGRRLRFLRNWTWQEIAVTAPTAVRDVLAGADHAAGAEIRLGPWDVRGLLEMPKSSLDHGPSGRGRCPQ
ncbi:hypothetical protein [Nonomuraea sp. NPDC049129]|uniref:hypothetical protein n=1 Tax=Nonomuraea sp. NPDC049129 TaxID=3155272 RepID=UPI00340BA12D